MERLFAPEIKRRLRSITLDLLFSCAAKLPTQRERMNVSYVDDASKEKAVELKKKRDAEIAQGTLQNSETGDIIITDKQIGKKVGKHASDWGLNAGSADDRAKMTDIIRSIIEDADEIRRGAWRLQPGDSDFYIKGEDVVVVNNKKFVTILKGGISSARIKNARK